MISVMLYWEYFHRFTLPWDSLCLGMPSSSISAKNRLSDENNIDRRAFFYIFLLPSFSAASLCFCAGIFVCFFKLGGRDDGCLLYTPTINTYLIQPHL